MKCKRAMIVAVVLLLLVLNPIGARIFQEAVDAFAPSCPCSGRTVDVNSADGTVEESEGIVDSGYPITSDRENQATNRPLEIGVSNILRGKPVFLLFYIDGCGFCQQQEPIIGELEQYYGDQIAFIRVNGEEHPNAVGQFAAHGYPTIFLVTGRGDGGKHDYECFQGFTEKETLRRAIDLALASRNPGELSVHLTITSSSVAPGDAIAFSWWVEGVYVEHSVEVEFSVVDPRGQRVRHEKYGWDGVGSESNPVTVTWAVPPDAIVGVYECKVEAWSGMGKPYPYHGVALVKFSVTPPPSFNLPDLTIVNVMCDRQNSRIGYEVKNIGNAVAPRGHRTALQVSFDRSWMETCVDQVDADLAPGRSYLGWFGCYRWPECQTLDVRICADKDMSVKESNENNNCIVRRCVCEAEKLPDLIITDVWSSESQIYYRIRNVGEDAAAPPNNALYVDGAQVTQDRLPLPLAPGEEVERRIDFRWQMTPPEDVIEVCADWTHSVEESDEENNCLEEIWEEEVRERLPDLVVSNIRNMWTRICFTIENIGEATADAGSIRRGEIVQFLPWGVALYVDGEKVSEGFVREPVGPGQELEEICFDAYGEWEDLLSLPGVHVISICVDTGDDIEEINEGNNCLELEVTVPTPSTIQPCPSGCECLREAEAEERGYTLCRGERTLCGYQYGVPMYCYEEYECPTVDFDFTFGGRIVSSSIPIFCTPDSDEPDIDGDVINDCWENAAMRELNPYVEFDEEEDLFKRARDGYVRQERAYPDDTVVNFVKVTNYTSSSQQAYILFYNVLTFTRDYGRFDTDKHNADTELVILAWRVMNPTTIKLEWVYTGAHTGETYHKGLWSAWEETCNEGNVCITSELGQLGDLILGIGNCDRVRTEQFCSNVEFYDNRVKIQSSEDKHATYPTCRVCEEVTLIEENLWGGGVSSFLAALGRVIEGLQGVVLILLDLFDFLFGWVNISDEKIGDQTVFVTYEGTPSRPGLAPVQSMNFEGHGARYSLHWSMRNLGNRLVDNTMYRHVKIELDMLHCVEETSWDQLSTADEIYLVVTGFSLYPETDAWSLIDNPIVDQSVDSGDDCTEIFSQPIVVFDGEVSEESLIGFNVIVMEQDWSDSNERRNMAGHVRDQILEDIRSMGISHVGDCGVSLETIFSRWLFAVGEDCAGGRVEQIRAYNIGEDSDHLLPPFRRDTSLAQFGFGSVRDEPLEGVECEGQRRFCGGLGCDRCVGSIMSKFEEVPDILTEKLEGGSET